ncbi:two-component system sensor histidine kinase NtrB [Maricurvus nonylphenolicus]
MLGSKTTTDTMATDPNYRHLIDSLNTAVVLVDNQLRIRHMNPAAEMLLAISFSQVHGTPLVHYFREGQHTGDEMQLAAEQSHNYTKRQAHWQLHTGKKLTVDYSVTPLPESEGLTIEIHSLDRLLRISREEALISSQETTRNLVRSMAHEIKNPLGGIRGAAQLLERELHDKSLDEFTQIIISEVDRLKNLVDRMLGPRQPLKFTETNIHEVLEHVASVIKVEAGESVRLKRDYDPSIPEFPGDKEQLVQALLNIIRNAMQALQEAGLNESGEIVMRTRIQRQFTIGRTHHNLVCRVEIVDNGPGIPPELIEDIFYPMISGRAEGTGLGLAISQHLIQQHHGLIECDSRPGQTKFTIYLPLEHKSDLKSEDNHAEA